MRTDKINERFPRRLRLMDAQLESARRDFAKATLARKIAPKSAEAKQVQTRAYLALCDAAKAAEVAS